MLEDLTRRLCEEDFYDTNFIDYELKWFTKDEFIENGRTIKKVYDKMSSNQKRIYKWYCYANTHTTLYQKNKIWDYLNDYTDYYDCANALLNNTKNYGMKI